MLEIVKNGDKLNCENCKEEQTKNILRIDVLYKEIVLCDKCLQELNRKIVECLAEKHL